MPQSTENLWKSLGAQESMGDIGAQKISHVAEWGKLPSGSRVTKGAVLFPRLEEREEGN
jgi:methionyl-tRNA synthetase